MNARLLIFAAMDTTSSSLARILHLLSEHQDVQDRLREEVLYAYKSFGTGDLDYDTLQSFRIWRQSVARRFACESSLYYFRTTDLTRGILLIRHSPFATMPRTYVSALPPNAASAHQLSEILWLPHHRARKDIMLPLDVPTSVGHTQVSEILIPEGTTIFVGIRAINRDPVIWGPDAKEWKPERFLNPLPENVTSAKVPGLYANL